MDRTIAMDSQVQDQGIEEKAEGRSVLCGNESEPNQAGHTRGDIPLQCQAETATMPTFKIKPRNDLIESPGAKKDYRWVPQNRGLYDQQSSSRQFQKDTFITIPWAILCNKKRFGSTIEARVLLAILAWTSDQQGISRLSDREIEIKRGPRPVRGKEAKNKAQPNTPIRILNQLEADNLIFISNRQGSNRAIQVDKTAIAICRGCQQNKKGQLLVHPTIFLLNLTTPQKIVLAARLAFQKMKTETMARRLGVSKISIKTHHLDLIKHKGALVKLEGKELVKFINALPEPLIKLFPTLNKTKYRYILGIDIDFSLLLYNKLSQSSEHSVRGQGSFQKTPSLQNQLNLPYKENQLTPPSRQENNMPRIPYDDTPEEHARWEAYRQNKIKTVGTASKSAHREFKPKRKIRQFKPTNDGRYDARYLADIDWIKKECPFINTSKPGTWIYDNALGMIRALDISPANGLRPDETKAILSVMVGKKPGQLNYPLSKEYITRNFLSIKFSESDRHELYARLNNMQSAEFKGKGNKVELAWAMRTNNNYSWLVHLWFAPPQRPREEFPLDLNEYKSQYERALGLMPVNLAKDQEGRLAWAVRALRKKYLEEFRARRPAGYEGDLFYGDWPKFFNSLAEHFDNQDVNIYPGWFRSDGEPVKTFLAESGFRDARAGCRPPAYNKEQEGSHAQW
jgi:hypothetical protein